MRIFRLAIVALIVLTVTQIVQSAEIAKEKITLAYAAISPSMSALWMAKEIGAFDKNGLNADLVYISSGATTIQALVGGSVQAALGASNAVVVLLPFVPVTQSVLPRPEAACSAPRGSSRMSLVCGSCRNANAHGRRISGRKTTMRCSSLLTACLHLQR